MLYVKIISIKKIKYCYMPNRIQNPNALTTSNAGKNVEQQKLLFVTSGTAKWYSHFGTKFGSFLQN